jgi:hypothetical protein
MEVGYMSMKIIFHKNLMNNHFLSVMKYLDMLHTP